MGITNERESTNIITVYHGSIDMFEGIDVAKGKPYKVSDADFMLQKTVIMRFRWHCGTNALKEKGTILIVMLIYIHLNLT